MDTEQCGPSARCSSVSSAISIHLHSYHPAIKRNTKQRHWILTFPSYTTTYS